VGAGDGGDGHGDPLRMSYTLGIRRDATSCYNTILLRFNGQGEGAEACLRTTASTKKKVICDYRKRNKPKKLDYWTDRRATKTVYAPAPSSSKCAS
jgi:hypothetical protein